MKAASKRKSIDLGNPVEMIALERFVMIQPFLKQGIPLAKLAAQENVPLRTMWHWVQKYKKYGLSGLARKERSDRGIRRHISRELRTLIEGMLLTKPSPSIAAVRRNLAEVCERENWALPSYSVIYDIAQNLDPALITLAIDGVKAYKNAYDLVYRREASRPNQYWQADHTELDCLVADSNGKARKPWLTVILDDFSRAVCRFARKTLQIFAR